jgi:hypothetical protein
MKLIDQIIVNHMGRDRAVKLYVGDLSCIPAHEAVDLLVVSAFPGDYEPTPTSLIGALYSEGISVERLAANMAVDLREFSACWLSHPIQKQDVHFHRLLCFEPRTRGRAPEVVGDVFRSLVPFITGSPPISQVAMPILASGDQGESPAVMLEAILSAAVHWLGIGLSLDCIKIVSYRSYNLELCREIFARVREAVNPKPVDTKKWRYDVFISYSHQNAEAVGVLVDELRRARNGVRIFLDRLELQTGSAWQQELYDVLDSCRKVVAVLSPPYLQSKVCKEEFNIAQFRHRESDEGVLLPVYLQTAELPTYMKLVQFEDAREANSEKLLRAARSLSERLC